MGGDIDAPASHAGAKARGAVKALYDRRSVLGLLGKHINIRSGKWVEALSGIGSNSDSFYEYLLKMYLLFGDDDHWRMFLETSRARVPRSVRGGFTVASHLGRSLGPDPHHLREEDERSPKRLHRRSQDRSREDLPEALSDARAANDVRVGRVAPERGRPGALPRYSRIGEHVRQGDWYADVDMFGGKPRRQHFENLQAFWPGVQILAGDVALASRSLNARAAGAR